MEFIYLAVFYCLIVKSTTYLSLQLALRPQGKSDPYLKVHTGSPKSWDKSGGHTTKVIKNTLNPVWNQTFEISLSNPRRQGLRFVLRDRDVGAKDDKMGEAHFLQMDKLIQGEELDCWLPVMMKSKQYGDVHIKITALDFGVLPPRSLPFINYTSRILAY
jgi:Ca2+-dependent lipid-binding protein